MAEDQGASSVVLDEALAESWLAQARCVPGWDAGPEYAPHPISVSRVEGEPFTLAPLGSVSRLKATTLFLF